MIQAVGPHEAVRPGSEEGPGARTPPPRAPVHASPSDFSPSDMVVRFTSAPGPFWAAAMMNRAPGNCQTSVPSPGGRSCTNLALSTSSGSRTSRWALPLDKLFQHPGLVVPALNSSRSTGSPAAPRSIPQALIPLASPQTGAGPDAGPGSWNVEPPSPSEQGRLFSPWESSPCTPGGLAGVHTTDMGSDMARPGHADGFAGFRTPSKVGSPHTPVSSGAQTAATAEGVPDVQCWGRTSMTETGSEDQEPNTGAGEHMGQARTDRWGEGGVQDAPWEPNYGADREGRDAIDEVPSSPAAMDMQGSPETLTGTVTATRGCNGMDHASHRVAAAQQQGSLPEEGDDAPDQGASTPGPSRGSVRGGRKGENRRASPGPDLEASPPASDASCPPHSERVDAGSVSAALPSPATGPVSPAILVSQVGPGDSPSPVAALGEGATWRAHHALLKAQVRHPAPELEASPRHGSSAGEPHTPARRLPSEDAPGAEHKSAGNEPTPGGSTGGKRRSGGKAEALRRSLEVPAHALLRAVSRASAKLASAQPSTESPPTHPSGLLTPTARAPSSTSVASTPRSRSSLWNPRLSFGNTPGRRRWRWLPKASGDQDSLCVAEPAASSTFLFPRHANASELQLCERSWQSAMTLAPPSESGGPIPGTPNAMNQLIGGDVLHDNVQHLKVSGSSLGDVLLSPQQVGATSSCLVPGVAAI